MFKVKDFMIRKTRQTMRAMPIVMQISFLCSVRLWILLAARGMNCTLILGSPINDLVRCSQNYGIQTAKVFSLYPYLAIIIQELTLS